MQNPRDCQSAFGNVYNTVASASKNFWAFAGVPQVSRYLLWRLRGVPQVSRYLLWRLRESRKSPGICFGVCGESRRSPGICFGVCGESRKSPGICFGVCGESRKCFGEPVGRYSMLSMTFLNKGISFFCRTHVIVRSPLQASADCIVQSPRKKEKGTAKNKFHSAFSITA